MREIIIDDAVLNVFLGDMMAIDGVVVPAANADGRAESMILGTAGAFAAATPTALAGAVVEFTPDFTDEGSLIRNFGQTGADRRAKLVYGTDVIYESTASEAIPLANINTNYNILAAVGNTTTGISAYEIGTANNLATGQLRILGASRTERDNAPAVTAIGATWRCRLNNSADDHNLVGTS
ncbi:MAG: hypothetical protein ACR2PR_06955 [Pseudohongiellaceae bacterium]